VSTKIAAQTRILFIDVVGFSKKPMENQKQIIQDLTHMVSQTSIFSLLDEASRVALPTGDGMALAFWGKPDFPLKCAVELQQTMERHKKRGKAAKTVNRVPVKCIACQADLSPQSEILRTRFTLD